MRRILKVLSLTISLCVLATGAAWAQATAQISGVVRDQQGGVLPGADVTATQTDTGVKRSAMTDVEGLYTLPNLPVGPYRIDVTLQGFKAFSQTGIVLQVNASPVINVSLSIGELAETVSVQGESPLVDTSRAGVGEVIENARIMELPLNGRNPTDLIELAGAAVNVPGQGASTRSFQGSSGGQGISVAGGQTFGTAYVLDGAMHNNPYDNLNLPLPFPDALQEFRVETGASAASNGVHSGASVSAVTKSGTNVFHGDVFEFWRNHKFNATNPFALIGPDGKRRDDGLNRHQFGGVIGGPIVKNRVHFFAGYQGTKIDQTPTDNIAFVPTPAMLEGDFTAITSPACNNGRQITLNAPFMNNRIEPARFSPAALNLARRLPSTTDPCGRVVFGTAANRDEAQFVTRLDYQWRQNHTIFGRYIGTSYNTPPALSLTPDNLLTSPFGGFDNFGHTLTVGETWVVNSTMVNSVRFAWNNTDVHRYHEGYFNANDLGINMYSYLDDYFIASVTGGFNVGSGVNNEARFKTTTYQFSDDLTWIRGSHQMGFGMNAARWESLSLAHVRSPGTFNFNGNATGGSLGLADFMVGISSQFLQAAPNTLDMYQYYFALYGADSWRVSPKLTLNYGLRWEPFLPQQIPNGYIYNFDLDRFRQGIHSQVFPLAPAGFVYPGDPEFVGGYSGMNKKWTNFAPRIAAAFDPRGDGRTTIRAGYSLGYDFVNGQYHLNTSVAPPWGAEVRLTNVPMDNPYATFRGGNPFPRVFSASTTFPGFGSFLAVDPDTDNTRQHSWNVVYQRQLGSNMLVSASYIGSHTSNLWNMKALNPGVFLGTGPCTLPLAIPPNQPVCSTDANLNARRVLSLENPNEAQFIGHLDQHDPSGRANYNGLLLSFTRRQVRGIGYSGNYTLSKCNGHPTQSLPNVGTGWADPNNPDYDYGPCESDRRHIVNATVGYDLPEFSNSALRAIASDWRVNGIFRAQSGGALTVTTGLDRAMTGVTTNQRADLVGGDGYGDKSLNQWLDRADFAQPALSTLGNSERGGWRGPSRWTIDMVVARMFRLGGTHEVELRLETFNLTNHFNWGNPVTNLANQNFGRILGGNGGGAGSAAEQAAGTTPRVLQFGIKYNF